VVPLHGENEQRKLSAYIVAAKEAVPAADEVRKCLRPKLPEHMVPAIYWRLDPLPLLPSGKIDRKALSPGVGEPLQDGQELITAAQCGREQVSRHLAEIAGSGTGRNWSEFF
jgi:acyl-coenzyme A synthetase/AMP-(fatty) acid ligase